MSIRRLSLPFEHGLPASGIPVLAAGCREAMALRPVCCFRAEGPGCFHDGGGGEFMALGGKGLGSR